MSGAAGATKTLSTRLIQLGALLCIGLLIHVVTRVIPQLPGGTISTVLALGFLLLAGTLMSEILETVGLPHLTGYILAGMIGGPYIGHWVDHQAVKQLAPVSTLA
jgi:hypothetical protein